MAQPESIAQSKHRLEFHVVKAVSCVTPVRSDGERSETETMRQAASAQ